MPSILPVGAVDARDTRASAGGNHESTSENLWGRGVLFRKTSQHHPPDQQECQNAFWATLPEDESNAKDESNTRKGDYHGLVKAVAMRFPSGGGANPIQEISHLAG